MFPVKQYLFSEMSSNVKNKYIFQNITKRKLTNIYHSHDFYEIIVTAMGCVEHIVNGEKKVMTIGDCIILRPGESHCFVSQSDDIKLICISTEIDEFNNFSNAFANGLRKSINNEKNEITFSCLERLNEIIIASQQCCNRIDNTCNCKSLLCIILSIYYANESNTIENSIPHNLKCAICHMCEMKNLKEGVNAIMELTNYSYSHLFRLMKAYYNQTPHEFITAKRMEFAYRRIISSDDLIESISESLGYNSLSHFNTIFKNKYGISPAKLRKKCKNTTLSL